MKRGEQNISVKEVVGPYNLIELHDSRFLAIPDVVDGKSVEELESSAGAIFGESLQDLREKIDDTLNWANSRGQLEKATTSQNAVFMQANSFAVAREQIKGKLLSGNTVHGDDGKNYIIHGREQKEFKTNWYQSFRDVCSFGRAVIRAVVRFVRTRDLTAVKASFNAKQTKALKRIIIKGSGGNRALSVRTTPYKTIVWVAVLGVYREILGMISHKETREFNQDNKVSMVVGANCEPEMIFAGKSENVIKLDRYYFVVPHGVPVDWSDLELLGRFPHSPNLKTLYETLDKTFDTRGSRSGAGGKSKELLTVYSEPEVVKELLEYGYRIVLFEGWYIGVPERLFDVDLTKQDILSEPGVIRDVAKEVVELEIVETPRAL